MKKRAIYLLILFFGLLSLAACTKDYHCTCTYNNTVVYYIDLGPQYQNKAQAACSRYDSTLRGIVWDCSLH
jgi:hypothetical protein